MTITQTETEASTVAAHTPARITPAARAEILPFTSRELSAMPIPV